MKGDDILARIDASLEENSEFTLAKRVDRTLMSAAPKVNHSFQNVRADTDWDGLPETEFEMVGRNHCGCDEDHSGPDRELECHTEVHERVDPIWFTRAPFYFDDHDLTGHATQQMCGVPGCECEAVLRDPYPEKLYSENNVFLPSPDTPGIRFIDPA